MTDHRRHALGDITLQSGDILPAAVLAYQTYGTLNRAKNNAVLLPTFFTGDHVRNEGFFGAGRAIDPSRHFIICINLFGNGLSSSPSNAEPEVRGAKFPRITFYDNIRAQRRLLREALGIERLALVAGWSMAGCQAFHWGCLYPDEVAAILPFCASAKTSPHNFVFLDGVKAALQADGDFAHGEYTTPPARGLKAFARVYAGWAYSQTFYREHWYRQLGFASPEALLVAWENDHLAWDANDLLAKIWTWQHGNIAASAPMLATASPTTASTASSPPPAPPTEHADFAAALSAIRAKTIIIACSDDLYFPPQDNAWEAQHLPAGELRIYPSPWGHCAASPGNDAGFTAFLDQAIAELLP